MRRSITQIAVGTASTPEAGAEYRERLYAVDTNGSAWRLDDADAFFGGHSATWRSLPELPQEPVV